jgi:hypothetical protein
VIIARDVKIVPRAAGERDNTSSAITLFARVAYNIFSTIEQKNKKKTTINIHFLHDRRKNMYKKKSNARI